MSCAETNSVCVQFFIQLLFFLWAADLSLYISVSRFVFCAMYFW